MGLEVPSAAAATAPAVFSVRSGASVVLPDAAGTYTTVVSLSVPKGSWDITANATAIDFHSGDFVRCRLENGGIGFDGGPTTYLENTVADLANAGVVKATATVTISLNCGHDHAATIAGQFYIDPGATLMAIAAGGKIKFPTAAAAAAMPTVGQQRSTAQVPLTHASSSVVTSVRVGPGTWALRANLSAVNFGAFDYVDCTIDDANPSPLGSQQVVAGNFDAIVSNLMVQAVHSSTSSATVKLICSTAETDSVYIDPGATLTATLVPTPANVVAGSAAKTLSDTGGVQTKVFHETLPAGAWRISSNMTTWVLSPNDSIGGATDFVRCTLLAGTTSIDGGATVLINSVDSAGDGGNYEQMIVNSATHTAKKPWTLSLSCSHDATISTGSHWQVFSTFNSSSILAVQLGPISATVS